MKIKYIAICLIMLCCFVGAVSATEDVATDDVVAVSDDVAVDEVVSEVDTSDDAIAVSENEQVSSEDDSDVLGDFQKHDVIYVNASSTNDPTSNDVHGQNWTDAYGTEEGLLLAGICINNGGTIYLADGTYTQGNGPQVNATIIGSNRDQTILNMDSFGSGDSGYMGNSHSVITYINMTFKNNSLNFLNGHVFINCTFVSSAISTNEEIYNMYQGAPENVADITESFDSSFIDCKFINYNVENSLLKSYRFSKVYFNNCNFENITASSIVEQVGGWTLNDGIYFTDCTFTNVNVKGLVNAPKNTIIGTEDGSRVRIENSKGISGSEVLTEGDRDYINSTASRVDTVLVANVNDDEKLVISLKDANDQIIYGAEILISVNGGEASSYALEDDGTYSIAIADLTTVTGPITITVEFKETDANNGNTTTVDYVIRNATSIAADNVTTTEGEAKNITATLKDNNGNPIAGKEIKVTVNGQNSTVTTDANGVANIPVSVDKAGVSEYTLFFAGDETNYKNSTLVVKVTVNEKILPNETSITAADVNATVGTATNITATLKDNNGNPIAGKTITVSVNGQNSTVTTDANGVANIPVSVDKAGVSEYTLFFAGDETNYKNSTLVVKVNVTEASSPSGSGNTTPANTTPTNPGKTDTTPSTKKVTPVATKITAKKATFKAKKKTKKYTIVLKAGKKAVKKVKVTLKVGKKTYKATTNSKGKATFKLTKLKKKGKYTAVIKFKGNKNYKATTKKVKITVKK